MTREKKIAPRRVVIGSGGEVTTPQGIPIISLDQVKGPHWWNRKRRERVGEAIINYLYFGPLGNPDACIEA